MDSNIRVRTSNSEDQLTENTVLAEAKLAKIASAEGIAKAFILLDVTSGLGFNGRYHDNFIYRSRLRRTEQTTPPHGIRHAPELSDFCRLICGHDMEHDLLVTYFGSRSFFKG